MTITTKGSKYEATKDLDTTAIAALIRSEIKAVLPRGFKVSVRSRSASMMTAIDVRVTAAPEGFAIRVPSELVDELRAEGLKCPWLTRPAFELLEQLRGIVDAYNRSASDPQSDYYNTRFYGDVEFASSLEQDPARVAGPAAVTLAVAEHRVAEGERRIAELEQRKAELEARLAVAEREANEAEESRDRFLLGLAERARATGGFAGVS